MKKLIVISCSLLALLAFQQTSPPNSLTPKEQKEGWRLLFDGKTGKGWRSARKATFPTKGWSITDGMLTIQPFDSSDVQRYGDLLTTEEFGDFDLMFDFKLPQGANSGVKYLVVEPPQGLVYGLEYQLLDDERHPDAKNGRNGNRKLGSLYDLLPATNKKPNPIGEWNTGRIVVKGNQVEHWLNGHKVLEYDRESSYFLEALTKSKYAAAHYNQKGRFGEVARGPILLQDHGNRVWFRNIKIKVL